MTIKRPLICHTRLKPLATIIMLYTAVTLTGCNLEDPIVTENVSNVSDSSDSSDSSNSSSDADADADADSPSADASRYQPEVSSTWQWQISGKLNTEYDADVYDIDLFDNSTSTIEELQADGKAVICYFSAGSYEDWRDDEADFPESALGKDLDGWDGEKWLDITNETVREIMAVRMDLAAEKGCDGVEPDNIDGYSNKTGFDLTYDDQIDYNIFLAEAAHERGLAVALKNDIEQVDDLVDYFDFSVNEECFEYNECESLESFIEKGKPVFHASYVDEESELSDKVGEICAEALALQFRALILPWDLDDSFRYSCD